MAQSPYRPTFPPRPILTGRPAPVECEMADKPAECFLMLVSDWIQVRNYYRLLERELTGACLALGHDETACRAK